MNKTCKTPNIFEVLGREIIRAKYEQVYPDELTKIRNFWALTLRLIADCLDSNTDTRIHGFLKEGTFSASYQPNAGFDLVREEVEGNPFPGSVFEIPQDLRGLLEEVIKAENKADTQKAMLEAFTSSALAEHKHRISIAGLPS